MAGVETGTITTDIPTRMDRLPWARWHWMVVIGLGTVWILDGLEVTIVGSMSAALKPEGTGLGLSSADVGMAGAMYVAINGSIWVGAALGSLLTITLLDANLVDPSWGWRAAFGLGAILAVGILVVRRHVPESPRWLFIHEREDEAERGPGQDDRRHVHLVRGAARDRRHHAGQPEGGDARSSGP